MIIHQLAGAAGFSHFPGDYVDCRVLYGDEGYKIILYVPGDKPFRVGLPRWGSVS